MTKTHEQTEAMSAVAQYRDRVYRFILKSAHDRAEAEDLTHQALVEAIRCFDSFRRDSAFSTWIFGIALNIVRAHGRRYRREARHEPEDALLELADHRPGPQAELERAQETMLVRRAIASLPGPFREVVILVCLEELSYEEAATVLGATADTVRSRLFKARRMMRDMLAPKLAPTSGPSAPR